MGRNGFLGGITGLDAFGKVGRNRASDSTEAVKAERATLVGFPDVDDGGCQDQDTDRCST
jgi:hypothetical protein